MSPRMTMSLASLADTFHDRTLADWTMLVDHLDRATLESLVVELSQSLDWPEVFLSYSAYPASVLISRIQVSDSPWDLGFAAPPRPGLDLAPALEEMRDLAWELLDHDVSRTIPWRQMLFLVEGRLVDPRDAVFILIRLVSMRGMVLRRPA